LGSLTAHGKPIKALAAMPLARGHSDTKTQQTKHMKTTRHIIILLIALIVGVAATTLHAEPGKGSGFIGSITSIDAQAGSMKLMTEEGKEMVVVIDEKTEIVNESGESMTMKDLKTSVKVRIIGGGKGPAKKIIIAS
jgi:hypothetical protein